MAEPVEVDRLHFLVHPGWGAWTEKRVLQRDKILFERYHKVASTLTRDEIMMALLVKPIRKKNSYEKFIDRHIRQLKETLRERLIILSEGMKLFRPDHEELTADFLRAKQVMLARGFDINRMTACLAFGETFKLCVPEAAKLLRKTYELAFAPVIRAHYSNVGVRTGETSNEERQRFREIKPYFTDPLIRINWDVDED